MRRFIRHTLAQLWDACAVSLNFSAAVLAIVGVAVVGVQVYGWLRGGKWSGIAPIDVLKGLGFESLAFWPYTASDWLGIAGTARYVLEVPPVSLTLLVLAYATHWLARVVRFYTEGAERE